MHDIITLLEDEKEVTAPSTSVILILDAEEPYTDEDSEDEEEAGAWTSTTLDVACSTRRQRSL